MNTYGLEKLGIKSPAEVHRNLAPAKLVELALARGEGQLSSTGALVVTTGKYTGRSPDDKFIVDTPGVHDDIDWGKVNRPVSREVFDGIWDEVAERKGNFHFRRFRRSRSAVHEKVQDRERTRVPEPVYQEPAHQADCRRA